MKTNPSNTSNTENLWGYFKEKNELSEEQLSQFKLYKDLLIEWNSYFNITAITDETMIIQDHFEDSLSLSKNLNMNLVTGIADVGSGGGFPGVPLAIQNTNLNCVLIEVNNKKITFLNKVIEDLGLHNIIISSLDWRTFIRKTNYPINTICARASLRPDELVRSFMEDSNYQNATIIYWASELWQPENLSSYSMNQIPYKIGIKQRKLVCITNPIKF